MAQERRTDNFIPSLVILDNVADTTEPVTGEALSNATPMHVAIVDASGDQISSFGGGTQYTEDAAAASNPTGTVPILIRADSPAGITSANGDNVGQRGTDYGAAYVTLLDSSGSEVSVGGGTQYDEDTQHTTGDKGYQMLAVRNDTLAALATTDGDYAPLQVNATGALFTDIADGGQLDTLLDTLIADVDGVEALLTTIDADTGSILADTANMDTNIGTIAGAVSGSEMQVDIVGITPDLMLGTDFSAVLGTSSLVTTADLDDNLSNSTDVLNTRSLIYGFDGTAWDRLRGTAADGLLVNLGSNNDVTLATLPDTSSGDLAAINTSLNNIETDADTMAGAIYTEDSAHGNADPGIFALAVRDTSPAATSGTDGDYEALHVNDDGGLWSTLTPSHQGGNSYFSSTDLDETEEQVSATACTVAYMYVWNLTAAVKWVQLFNATAASIAPGTNAPDLNFPIPANSSSLGGGVTIPIPQGGIQFSTALSIAITGAIGTDATSPGTNVTGAIVIYKN